jgi:hypothetical protein
MNQIRPIALCVFHNNNRILVFEGYDKAKDEIFYRPLGGGIEFGEKGDVNLPKLVPIISRQI